ncbi:MAG: hypothetical protein M9938_09365 [Solirubrobacterales bacterium]|nr:hypothetical protein [Solirubrobacterales bacterium]
MTKTELHRLVDQLPEDSLAAVATMLERAQDPVIAKLDAAPIDDEELTEADRAAAEAAASERGIPWSEALAGLAAE